MNTELVCAAKLLTGGVTVVIDGESGSYLHKRATINSESWIAFSRRREECSSFRGAFDV